MAQELQGLVVGRKPELQAGLRGRPPTGSLQLCSFVLGRQLGHCNCAVSFWDRTFTLFAGLHSVFFLLTSTGVSLSSTGGSLFFSADIDSRILFEF